MTFKEFEDKKDLIMGMVTDLIINNSSKKMVAKLDKINCLIRDIQPPRPTCATCNKSIGCSILYYTPNIDTDGFGCNKHSDCGAAEMNMREFYHEVWEALEWLKEAKKTHLSDELYRKIAIKLNELQPPN